MNQVTHPAPAVISADRLRMHDHRVRVGRRLASQSLARLFASHISEDQALHVWAKVEALNQAKWDLDIAMNDATARIRESVRTQFDGPRATPEELGRQ